MLKLFVILTAIFANSVLSQKVKFGCKTNEGINGMCKLYENCESIKRNSGILPTLCGRLTYQGGGAVVCCTDIHEFLTKDMIDFHYPGMKTYYKKCLEYIGEKNRIKRLQTELYKTVQCANHICTLADFIHGGTDADIDEFPHMAQLGWERVDGKGYEWSCGGSLISEDFVLTAAHCLYVQDSELISPEPTMVRLGGSNIKDILISSIIAHPDYKPPKKYNDIALVKLATSIEFSERIRPACLWSNSTLSGDAVTIGWGSTSTGVIRSEKLQKVTLNIYEDSECKRGYPISRQQPRGITNSQFCAGYKLGGKDSCQGDSGGPIQIKNKIDDDMFDIIGITSFGAGCGSTKGGVYTRVSHYVSWIEKNVWPNELEF